MGKKSKSDAAPAADSTAAAAAPEVPTFSADVLSKLSARVAENLSKVAVPTNGGAKKTFEQKKAANKDRKKEQRDRKKNQLAQAGQVKKAETIAAAAPTTPIAIEKKPAAPAKTTPAKTAPKPATPAPAKSTYGVKNKQNETAPPARSNVSLPTGKSKPASKPTPQKADKSKKETAPVAAAPQPKKKIDKDALLKEIIELGGSKEDLALVDGLESDDDLEEFVVEEKETTGKEKKVKKNDIEAFMKEIGLEAGKVPDVDPTEALKEKLQEGWSDEEDEEEEEEEEYEDEEQDVEMEDSEPAPPVITGVAGRLTFPPRPDWHAEPLPELTPPASAPSLQQIIKIQDKARELLDAENELYSSTHLVKSSDRQFLSQIMKSGTLSDKISALTLVCQESPLHTKKTLESLLGLARKKSRSQAVQAMRAIKDLFAQGAILPSNRKLKAFMKQPCLASKGVTDKHLIAWAYEDWLKNFYFEVLKTLESLCADQLEYARKNAVSFVYELLKEKPEQEANLLRLLVNKLGDKDKQVASKVSYLLLQIQISHPAMKSVVINTIEQEVIFRPGNTDHAKYYAILTLNQTVLGSNQHDVANKLLNIYFGVFTGLLKNDKHQGTKESSTGGKHTSFKDEEKDKNGKPNRKAIARMKAQEKASQHEEEINAKLISGVLTGVNRAFPFSQVDDDIFDRHMDTLFRVTHSGNFNTGIQALMLIFQVSNSKQAVSDRFYRTLYESLLDPRLVTSSKQALYLNLLFRALKSDTSIKRIKAFIKRILQVATVHQPAFIIGVIYLLSELETAMPSVRTLLTDPEPNEDDDEEVFHDAPDSDDETTTPSSTHPSRIAEAARLAAAANRPKYDGRKRDPLFAEADRSCLWEILPFTNHFHPTVALFAQCLLDKKPMPSKPDLGLHSLSHFLDRFVYRNPKAQPATTKGQSIMQPLAGGNSQGMVLATKTGKKAQIPVNAEAFWKKNVESVRPEEVFFHRYFNITKQGEEGRREKREEKRRGKEEDSEDEDAGEDEVWEALVKSNPDLEGSGDEGSVDFDDDEDLDLDDMSDDDSEGGIELDDDDWSDDEDSEAEAEESDAEASKPAGGVDAFEAALGKASKKRARAVEEDEDEDSDDGLGGMLDGGSDEEDSDKEVEEKGDKKGKKEESKAKRRKLKGLPTFASMDEYMHMLEDDEE